MAKDRELQDHERAHSGQPGAKPRHGANVTGSNVTGRHNNGFSWASRDDSAGKMLRSTQAFIKDRDNP